MQPPRRLAVTVNARCLNASGSRFWAIGRQGARICRSPVLCGECRPSDRGGRPSLASSSLHSWWMIRPSLGRAACEVHGRRCPTTPLRRARLLSVPPPSSGFSSGKRSHVSARADATPNQGAEAAVVPGGGALQCAADPAGAGDGAAAPLLGDWQAELDLLLQLLPEQVVAHLRQQHAGQLHQVRGRPLPTPTRHAGFGLSCSRDQPCISWPPWYAGSPARRPLPLPPVPSAAAGGGIGPRAAAAGAVCGARGGAGGCARV